MKLINEQMEDLLGHIYCNCPHKSVAYGEDGKFESCAAHGNGWGQKADDCYCTLECIKYVKS